MDFDFLLDEYRTLWNNRTLKSVDSSEKTLLEAIERELLDENSHPRIRKGIHEKFFFASKRITESTTISNEVKVSLLSLYIQILEQLKQ
jgi:hypothetical protein